MANKIVKGIKFSKAELAEAKSNPNVNWGSMNINENAGIFTSKSGEKWINDETMNILRLGNAKQVGCISESGELIQGTVTKGDNGFAFSAS